MPITLSVNVDKIDKDKLFKGKQGRYLDLILFETPDSEYGDYLVKQQAKKGEKMPILGNAKIYKPKDNNKQKDEQNGNGNNKGIF